jgi:hypothetical protein
MATKKMIKSKVKKYNEGGTSRKINLFGKTYTKKVNTVTNDDGTVTKNKIKTVSRDGDLEKIKLKTKTTLADDPYTPISKGVNTTKFMGNGDSVTKTKSYNLPSNASTYKKGGSTKSKKVIKSKKK